MAEREGGLRHDFDGSTIATLRRRVRRFAEDNGLSDVALYRWVVAVNEIVTNAVQHGGGRGRLAMWRSDDHLCCEVSDRGPGMPETAHLRGAPPPPDAVRGRGLWLARSGSASLAVRSGGTGTTVVLTCPVAP